MHYTVHCNMRKKAVGRQHEKSEMVTYKDVTQVARNI